MFHNLITATDYFSPLRIFNIFYPLFTTYTFQNYFQFIINEAFSIMSYV